MPKQTRKSWKPPEGFYIVVDNKKKFIVGALATVMVVGAAEGFRRIRKANAIRKD